MIQRIMFFFRVLVKVIRTCKALVKDDEGRLPTYKVLKMNAEENAQLRDQVKRLQKRIDLELYRSTG